MASDRAWPAGMVWRSSSWRSARCSAATRYGRSSGGRAWRARIPTTPGSRSGTCRPWRWPAIGRSSPTRQCALRAAAHRPRRGSGARGGRAGGTAQARVSRRFERCASPGRTISAVSVTPDGDRPESLLACSGCGAGTADHAAAGLPLALVLVVVVGLGVLGGSLSRARSPELTPDAWPPPPSRIGLAGRTSMTSAPWPPTGLSGVLMETPLSA